MVLIVNKQLLFECVRLLVVLYFAENSFCKLYKYMINSKNLIPLNLIVLGFPKIVQVQKFQEWILHHLQLYYYSLCISILFWVKLIFKNFFQSTIQNQYAQTCTHIFLRLTEDLNDIFTYISNKITNMYVSS